MRLLLILAIACMVACNDNAKPTTTTTPAGDSSSLPQYIKLGGVDQAVLIRGVDTTNPILLMMHGGPGFTEMALFSTYNKDLEKHFIVVNWDQRGAGLSYHPGIPDSTMNIQQFVRDAHELVTWLKKRYNKEKIYALGHSWGSVLGVNLVQQFPQDFYAYIGVGQVVNMFDNERISYRYTLDTAIAEKNEEAIQELKSIQQRYPPNAKANLDDLILQRKWLNYYGGSVYKQRNADKIFSRIRMSNNPVYDTARAAKGNAFTMKLMTDDLMNVDLIKTAPKLDVPVYLIESHHDYNTPWELAEKYMEILEAPHKEIFWLENSGHWLPFEEPEKFNDALIYIIRKHSNP